MKKQAKAKPQGLSYPAKELKSIQKAWGQGAGGGTGNNFKQKNEIQKDHAANTVEEGCENER